MDKVSLRLSEEEKGILNGHAKAMGVTLSELIRELLFAPQGLTVSLRVEELARQIGTLSEAVARLAKRVEDKPLPVPEMPAALGSRLEQIELVLGELSDQIAGLRAVVSEPKTQAPGWVQFLSRNR